MSSSWRRLIGCRFTGRFGCQDDYVDNSGWFGTLVVCFRVFVACWWRVHVVTFFGLGRVICGFFVGWFLALLLCNWGKFACFVGGSGFVLWCFC